MPTVFENYTACLETEEQRVELSLWDTSGKTVPPPPKCPIPPLLAAAAFLRGSRGGEGRGGDPALRIELLARKVKEGRNVKILWLGH